MFSLARTVLFGFFHWISASTAQLLSEIHPGAKLIRLTHRTTAVAKHFAQYSAVIGWNSLLNFAAGWIPEKRWAVAPASPHQTVVMNYK